MTDVVLVTGARAPVALDIARSFVAAGSTVHLADSVTAHAARWSRLGVPVHRLPSPRHEFAAFRAALHALAARIGATLIVPTCEEVFYVSAAGESLPLFAPPLATLRTLHSKHDFIALARAAGVRVPATRLLASPDDLTREALGGVVLKPEFSRFAAATLIRPTARRAAHVHPSAAHHWVAQDFVAGEELCLWSAVRDGKVTAAAVYRPVLRHGRSAAYAFAAVDCPAALKVAHAVARATRMTGHLSFDLIVTPNGAAIPIECNPRAVSGVHLFAGDALARSILGEPQPSPPPGTLRYLAPAMALLGLPAAVADARLGTLMTTWRAGEDAISRPGDRWPLAGALLDAARFAALGLSRRRSPTRQTTDDIEWNGEPIA